MDIHEDPFYHRWDRIVAFAFLIFLLAGPAGRLSLTVDFDNDQPTSGSVSADTKSFALIREFRFIGINIHQLLIDSSRY